MRASRFPSAIAILTAAAWVRADPAPTTRPDSPGTNVTITIDATQASDLTDWANDTLVPVLKLWYPKIVAELESAGHPAPDHFSIRFDPSYKGVAATSGTHVVANPNWIRSERKGEAIGALLHEEVHVVQNPWHAMHGKKMPGWLLEGSCDYIRWFQYEPANHRPHPRYDQAKYDAAYRVTAAFLQYVITKYDKHIVPELNAASYAGAYSDDLWVKYTGKTVAALGAEWKDSLPHRPSTRPAAASAMP